MSINRLLLVKIGTERGLERIVNQLREFLPNVELFGISTENKSTESLYDISIAHSTETTLGAYPVLTGGRQFVRPELYAHVMRDESAMLRMCERVALHDLTTVKRPAHPSPRFTNSFDDRQQLVLRQLAFWDFVFEHYKINAVVLQNYGHNMWDFALETVARSRQVPLMFFHEVRPFLSSLYVCESLGDLDDLSFGKEVITEARARGWLDGDSNGRQAQMTEQAGLKSGKVSEQPSNQKDKLWINLNAFSRLRHYSSHPFQKLRLTFSRRLLTRRSRREERFVSQRIVPTQYMFMELQSQPNGTTARKGWMYADLRELVAHIAWSLPEGQSLVVRESPRQSARKYPRRKGFWKSLAAIPRVVVVDSSPTTTDLVNNASAVIEVSYSTLAFNAVSQGTPVVIIGHTHLRGILGVFAAGIQGDLAKEMSRALKFSFKKPQLKEIHDSIELWMSETRSSTVEGALSSIPQEIVDRAKYTEAVSRNLAGVIAAWVLRNL